MFFIKILLSTQKRPRRGQTAWNFRGPFPADLFCFESDTNSGAMEKVGLGIIAFVDGRHSLPVEGTVVGKPIIYRFFWIHSMWLLGISEPSTGTLFFFLTPRNGIFEDLFRFAHAVTDFVPSQTQFARLKEGNVWVDDFFLFPVLWDMLLRSLEGKYHYR